MIYEVAGAPQFRISGDRQWDAKIGSIAQPYRNRRLGSGIVDPHLR
jgi:hypothetical protein